jgi:peptidoglycan/LPS O-acetylase OafA/YrhL
VRAIAIAFVLATHAYHPAMPGGWIGVDVFFVLSGYLITSILLNELRRTDQITLGNFYMRRFLRLTPPLVVLAVFQFARSAFSQNGSEIREATIVGVAYLQNWNAVFGFAPHDVMMHTWSLAVEEQFYWLWPLLLPLFFNKRPLAWIAGALAAMTLTRFALWRHGFPEAALQAFIADRPVGLLVGCALALLPTDRWRPHAFIAPGALVVLVALGLFAERSVFAFLIAPLAASLATGALIVCLQGPSLIAHVLSLGPIRYTGKISYGLYLYHWPVFILGESVKIHTPFHLYAVALIAVIFAIAALSFESVEKPFLKLKDRFQSNREPRQPSGLMTTVA